MIVAFPAARLDGLRTRFHSALNTFQTHFFADRGAGLLSAFRIVLAGSVSAGFKNAGGLNPLL
jgi:hypothetical protein